MRNAIRNVAAALLAAAVLTAGTGVPAEAQEKLTDLEIGAAVDNELTWDPATPANDIGVSAAEGIVTLTGTVDNVLAKDRAEKIATTIKGVRGIVNRIRVTPPDLSDSRLRGDVKEALQWDAATESWEITPSVDDGVVTLTGEVDSWQEKRLAEKVAKGVRGVKAVKNDISVAYKTSRGDYEIRKDIEGALRWNAYVEDVLIGVSVDDGKVVLSGTVGSEAEKNEAFNQAWLVTGVKDVTNELEVQWWARDEKARKDKYVSRTDAEVKAAVKDALLYDPRVMSFNVGVEADNGYVTLTGTVDNAKAKSAAARDARGVVGVWAVSNRLKAGESKFPDARVADRVRRALLLDPYVEKHEITVSVVGGTAYLYGSVDTAFEKAQAEDVAARQKGVRIVRNFLNVSGPLALTYRPYVDDWYIYGYDWYTFGGGADGKSDWEIEMDIEREYFWSPFVDGDNVNVSVDNGVANLTGTVDTWGEWGAAVENALEGGAVAVDNDLKVRYGPEYYAP